MGKKKMYAINWAHTNKFDSHFTHRYVFFFWGLLGIPIGLLLVPILAKFTPEKCKI
jgi:hypothetical protein